MGWNHNTHYHSFTLSLIPSACGRALDVGCGQGKLAQKLAEHCDEVVAIDVDHECISRAKAAAPVPTKVSFLHGDVLTEPSLESNFDFVVAVATLHHLPLRSALLRLCNLLRSGGVLVVVGLYRAATPIDFAVAAVAFPISRIIRLTKGSEEVGAPLHEPAETLPEIRKASESVLPGAIVRRRLFFRYTLVWTKP